MINYIADDKRIQLFAGPLRKWLKAIDKVSYITHVKSSMFTF